MTDRKILLTQRLYKKQSRQTNYIISPVETSAFAPISLVDSLKRSAEKAPTSVIAAEQRKTTLKAETLAFIAIRNPTCCKTLGLEVLITVNFWTFINPDVTLLVKIVAKIATPKAPAIFLTNAKIEDATPTSCKGTGEIEALVMGAKVKPRPRAKRDNKIAKWAKLQVKSMPEKRNKMNAAHERPTKTTYLGANLIDKRAPVCAPSIMPAAIGKKRYPVFVTS